MSNVTNNISGDPARIKKRNAKDNETTTAKLGMIIIGYAVKGPDRNVVEKFHKRPYIPEEGIPQVLQKIFRRPGSEELNLKAQEYILQELRRFLGFVRDRSSRDFKGGSVLIIVDHFTESYCMKFIDISSVKVY